MNVYKVKAKVLNLGLGKLIVERLIYADSKEEASEKFIEKYLTIDILEVIEV